MNNKLLVLLIILLSVAGIKFGILILNPVPKTAFAETALPPAPDYKLSENWAALPDKEDYADFVPQGSPFPNEQDNAPVDVFYVHPTVTYYGNFWVSPIDDLAHQVGVDYFTLRPQASAFNYAGKIYAPRYRSVRQAIWDAPDQESRYQAQALAYQDVKNAFLYYMENWNEGRPIIIASHSQGTMHTIRLIRELFDGKPLQEKLVAAYLVGISIPDTPWFENIPLCTQAEATNCYVTWNTVLNNYDSDQLLKKKGLKKLECVNPLSWKADNNKMESSNNNGSVPLISKAVLLGKDESIYPKLISAQCNEEGLLWIDKKPEGFGFNFGAEHGNYHSYDFGFYYESIRENAKARSTVYLSNKL